MCGKYKAEVRKEYEEFAKYLKQASKDIADIPEETFVKCMNFFKATSGEEFSYLSDNKQVQGWVLIATHVVAFFAGVVVTAMRFGWGSSA